MRAWKAWQRATPPNPPVNKYCSCVARQFYAGGKISACCLVIVRHYECSTLITATGLVDGKWRHLALIESTPLNQLMMMMMMMIVDL